MRIGIGLRTTGVSRQNRGDEFRRFSMGLDFASNKYKTNLGSSSSLTGIAAQRDVELMPAQNFTNWTNVSATDVTATSFTTAGAGGVQLLGFLTVGKTYELTLTITNTSTVNLFASSNLVAYAAGATRTVTSQFTADGTVFYFRNSGAGSTTITGLSLKETAGYSFTRNSQATVFDENGRLVYAPHNLVSNSETPNTGGVGSSISTLAGFTSAISLQANASNGNAAVGHPALIVGQTYAFSAFVQMDDGGAPIPGSNTTTGDFAFGFDGGLALASSVELISGSLYRIKGTKVATAAITYAGLYKYSTQSARGLRVSGFQVELAAATRPYIKTTAGAVYGPRLDYDPANVTNKPHNMLLHSGSFDNAVWIKTRSSIQPDVIAGPLGLTADAFVEDGTASASHSILQTGVSFTAGVTYTYSVIAKAAGRDQLQVQLPSTAFTNGPTVFFDLTTLMTYQVSGTAIAKITNLGDGWYRCSATATATTTAVGNCIIWAGAGLTSIYTGTSVVSLYLAGAQVIVGAAPIEYAATTTTTIAPSYEPLGLLIEEARTNYLPDSDGNSTTYPARNNVVTAAVTIPDFANAVEFGDNSLLRYAYKSFAATIGTTYTFSCFVEMMDNAGPPVMTQGTASGDMSIIVEGGLQANPVTITPAGGNRYRVSMTHTAATGTGGWGLVKYVNQTARMFKMSGVQLEVGTFATSYIPTQAAATTRAAEIMTLGLGWYNPTEGTLVMTARAASYGTVAVIRDSGGTAYAPLLDYNAVGVRFVVRDAGASQVSQALAVPLGAFNTWGGAYKTNDFAMGAAGTLIGTDAFGTVPVGMTSLQLGAYNTSGAAPHNGHIKRILYKNVRVPNAELVTMTIPDLKLDLDFTSEILDSRINFTRGSAATRTNRQGLLETVASGQPRFDYDPVTKVAKGLLVEEQRTNMLVRSGDANLWSRNDATSVLDASVKNPDGTSAYKTIEGVLTSAQHRLQQAVTMVDATYTATIYAKASERTLVSLRIYDSVGQKGVIMANLLTGETVSSAGTTTSVTPVGNGWYRLQTTAACVAGVGTIYANIVSGIPSSYLQTYDGDGVSGVYLWGLQLEAGTFATSYIPTGASAVTRAADIASMPATPWLNQGKGTLQFTYTPRNGFKTALSRVAELNNGTNVTRILLYIQANGSTLSQIQKASVVQANPAVPTSAILDQENRHGFTWDTNFASMALNGALAPGGDDITVDVPTDLTTLNIGWANSGASDTFNGHIKRLRYWNGRHTNAILQGLTE